MYNAEGMDEFDYMLNAVIANTDGKFEMYYYFPFEKPNRRACIKLFEMGYTLRFLPDSVNIHWKNPHDLKWSEHSKEQLNFYDRYK